jgi:hypothetical protein
VSNRKIAILVADTFGEPFETLKNGIHNRLWEDATPNIEVFYFRGKAPTRIQKIAISKSDSLRYSRLWPVQRILDALTLARYNFSTPIVTRNGNELDVEISEGLRYLGVKDRSVFSWALENKFDFVYKTTLSSVVNLRKMNELIESVETKKPLYAGSKIEFGRHPFVSGANLLLNRPSLEILCHHTKLWNHGDLDDVAIGKIFKRYKVPITELTTHNFDTVDSAIGFSIDDYANLFHARCKAKIFPRNDAEIISIVYNAIRRSSNGNFN